MKEERIEEVAGKDCVGLVGRLEASGFYSERDRVPRGFGAGHSHDLM